MREKVMMLNMESPVEAFVCSAWISSRLTDPRAASILSEVSMTNVTPRPRSPTIRGTSPVRLDVIPRSYLLLAVFLMDFRSTFKHLKPNFLKKLEQKDIFCYL